MGQRHHHRPQRRVLPALEAAGGARTPSWATKLSLLGGLFFIAFMKNPAQFIKLQQSLAADALNEYIQHTGSAVFACPPGLMPGQHWGDDLFT
jgi:hypothetical protein